MYQYLYFIFLIQAILVSAWICTSILTITLMAMDRCLSIYWAMEYILIVTAKNLKILLVTIWLFSFALATFGIMKKYRCYGNDVQGMDGAICILYFTCCVIMVISYSTIYHVVRNHQTQEKHLHIPSHRYHRARYKALITVTTIIAVFILNYTPIMVYLIADIINPNICKGINSCSEIPAFLVVFNSFINPFIYVWRYNECRKHFTALLCFWNRNLAMNINRSLKRSQAPFLDAPASDI